MNSDMTAMTAAFKVSEADYVKLLQALAGELKKLGEVDRSIDILIDNLKVAAQDLTHGGNIDVNRMMKEHPMNKFFSGVDDSLKYKTLQLIDARQDDIDPQMSPNLVPVNDYKNQLDMQNTPGLSAPTPIPGKA